MDEGLFELNPEQQRAFNRLKRAYRDCEKLDVLFVNHYGRLTAYDKDKVNEFGDEETMHDGVGLVLVPLSVARDLHGTPDNFIDSCASWVDDENSHVLGLTPLGAQIHNDEYDERHREDDYMYF